jgi:hypothetical protein
MVDVSLCNVGVEILALNEPQEEFIYNLDMRPSNFQHGLILLWVKCFTLGRHRRRDGAEQVLCKHLNHAGIHGFRYDRPVVGNII